MNPERMMERLAVQRLGCVRAAWVGASCGVIATAGLIVGVAASGGSQAEVLRAGLLGLIAGAMAMAASQFMASSQMAPAPDRPAALPAGASDLELVELAAIYRQRGLDENLAVEAAMAAHWSPATVAATGDAYCAGPIQAALTTALTFTLGAALPLGFASMFSEGEVVPGVIVAALGSLVLLALVSASRAGPAIGSGTARLVGWGAVALGLCWLAGRFYGVSGV